MKLWITSLALAAGVSAAFASTDEDRKKWWGVDVGAYFPTQSEIRDAFGDTLMRFGVRPFERRISDKWKFIVDVHALSARKDGNKLFAMPVTFGLTRSFGNPESKAIPFVQVAAGPAYYDYTIYRDVEVSAEGGKKVERERISKKRFGGNANFEVGMLFDHRFALVARADVYTKSDDFDFSGISLTLSYAAFRW